MKSDLEIAAGVPCRPISQIAASLGLTDADYAPYGRNKAKLEPGVFERLADRPDGHLVLVTAITPTPAGEGKTTTTIGLTDALRRRGEAMPAIAGFASAREEIRSSMLRASGVYELLEPASGCDARHVAFVERLAGEEFLATWLVSSQDADAVRRIAWRAGGPRSLATATTGNAQSVAVRGTLDDVNVNDIAPWLGKFISFEESDVEAVKLLALHLAAKTGPTDGDFLGSKTQAFRMREGLIADAKPRLIGKKFRAAEQARQERDEIILQANALSDKLAFAQTDDYVIRVARDELGMIMPGEVRYVNGAR